MFNQLQSFFNNSTEVEKHYAQLANKYDTSWEHDPELIIFFSQKIVNFLELTTSDILVDLGCGTGSYTKKIREFVQLNNPIICVDNSVQMLEKIPKNEQYRPLLMDAIEFTEQPELYNKVLIKHMAHHIDNRAKLVDNLFKHINNDGIILLVMMQPILEYPLFNKAAKKCEELRVDYRELVCLYQAAGFKTDVFCEEYPVSIDKHKYFQMVRHRYLCLLSYFNDDEIEKGIQELDDTYKKQSVLNFKERYLFIKGRK